MELVGLAGFRGLLSDVIRHAEAHMLVNKFRSAAEKLDEIKPVLMETQQLLKSVGSEIPEALAETVVVVLMLLLLLLKTTI